MTTGQMRKLQKRLKAYLAETEKIRAQIAGAKKHLRDALKAEFGTCMKAAREMDTHSVALLGSKTSWISPKLALRILDKILEKK